MHQQPVQSKTTLLLKNKNMYVNLYYLKEKTSCTALIT